LGENYGQDFPRRTMHRCNQLELHTGGLQVATRLAVAFAARRGRSSNRKAKEFSQPLGSRLAELGFGFLCFFLFSFFLLFGRQMAERREMHSLHSMHFSNVRARRGTQFSIHPHPNPPTKAKGGGDRSPRHHPLTMPLPPNTILTILTLSCSHTHRPQTQRAAIHKEKTNTM